MIEFVIIVAAVIFIWLYVNKSATETKAQSEEPVVEQEEARVIKTKVEEDAPEAENIEPVTEVVAKDVAASAAVSVVPQDSILESHYMQNLIANEENAGEQIPEDSVLRRHYLQNLAAQEPCVTTVSVATVNAVRIPEDAVLKRHFTQKLVAEVAATMSDRPTDSTLKRHYDTQLFNAVVARLQALK